MCIQSKFLNLLILKAELSSEVRYHSAEELTYLTVTELLTGGFFV